MSDVKGDEELNHQMIAVLQKLEELESRIDLLHESTEKVNEALDILIRFSMTSKAFMELAIGEGLVDPRDLGNLASIYERDYQNRIEGVQPSSDSSHMSELIRSLKGLDTS